MKNLQELQESIEEINKLKQLLGVQEKSVSSSHHLFELGQNYLIRTVTMIISGKLLEVGPQELKLTQAAWIADTGRFHENLKSCKFSEVEPFPNDVILGRGSIIDATIISTLPTEVK